MQTKRQQLFDHLERIPRTLRLVWAATGHWSTAWLLLLLLHGLIPAGLVYWTRHLVDALAAVLQNSGWINLQPLLLPTLFVGSLVLLNKVVESALAWVHVIQSDLVRDHLAALIHQQSAAADLAFYETPDFHDHLQRARDDALYLPLEFLESSGEVLGNCLTLLVMSALLYPYGWWLPVTLLLSTAPAFLVVLRNHAGVHRWWEAVTAQQRWARYYDTVLTAEEAAAEVRLFRLGAYFSNAYQTIRKTLREEYARIAWRQNVTQLLASLASLAITALVAGAVLWRAGQGWYSLGDLALLYQAFSQGQALLHTLLGSVGRVYRHLLFLSNLFAFLDLKQQVADPIAPQPAPESLRQGIHFHNVTFAYPGSQRPALQNFSMTIPAGQTVAIVGENGAGKSTLVKLICRFYDPSAGSITFDTTDLRQMKISELHEALSVMFQRPVPYHATAADNIAVGSGFQIADRAAIEHAARAAGVHEIITHLPKGYDTLLGKWFVDGTGLSGGEWQRIALARAFLRQTGIILLDEPTSAMDTWAEAEWLDRFHELVRGRTAVIITHRFTTAMRADLILVMRAGQIVEAGNHQALLAQNGHYAQSWRRQIAEVTPHPPNTTINGVQPPLRQRTPAVHPAHLPALDSATN